MGPKEPEGGLGLASCYILAAGSKPLLTPRSVHSKVEARRAPTVCQTGSLPAGVCIQGGARKEAQVASSRKVGRQHARSNGEPAADGAV